jgi:hypothetical protein
MNYQPTEGSTTTDTSESGDKLAYDAEQDPHSTFSPWFSKGA